MTEARRQCDPVLAEDSPPSRLGIAEPARPCIELERVSLRFQSEHGEVQALSDISLSVDEGEFVALLGPTGCGKSSLLRLVSDLLAPTAGTIAVRGEPAAAARRVNQFGFIFQEPALLSWRSALGNASFHLKSSAIRRRNGSHAARICSIPSAC